MDLMYLPVLMMSTGVTNEMRHDWHGQDEIDTSWFTEPFRLTGKHTWFSCYIKHIYNQGAHKGQR